MPRCRNVLSSLLLHFPVGRSTVRAVPENPDESLSFKAVLLLYMSATEITVNRLTLLLKIVAQLARLIRTCDISQEARDNHHTERYAAFHPLRTAADSCGAPTASPMECVLLFCLLY
jgi:hypothetical protein